MNNKEKLYQLTDKIQELQNELYYIKGLVAADEFKEKQNLIGSAWKNPNTQEYFFVLDIRPNNTYRCTVLSFSQNGLIENHHQTSLDSLSMQFSSFDFSSIFGKIDSIMIRELIKNERISNPEFEEQFKANINWGLFNVPLICESKRHQEIEQIETEYNKKDLR